MGPTWQRGIRNLCNVPVLSIIVTVLHGMFIRIPPSPVLFKIRNALPKMRFCVRTWRHSLVQFSRDWLYANGRFADTLIVGLSSNSIELLELFEVTSYGWLLVVFFAVQERTTWVYYMNRPRKQIATRVIIINLVLTVP